MGYSSLNFAGYADLRPEAGEKIEPDDKTLKGIIYAEARPLFDMVARVVGQYATTGQDQKLRLFFEMMQDALNDTIDMLTGETPPMPG